MGKMFLVLLALAVVACAIAATQMESCDPHSGNHHAITSCPAGILPVPLVLGLMLLSLLPLISFQIRPQLVLVLIDRPPRRPIAR